MFYSGAVFSEISNFVKFKHVRDSRKFQDNLVVQKAYGDICLAHERQKRCEQAQDREEDIDGSVFKPDLGEIPLCATSFKIPNPVVRIGDLDEDDQEDLYAQINELTRKIELKFRQFFDQIFTSFRESQDVDRDRLVMTLINREGLFKEGELAEATSVSDVLKAIRPYCSYFNYDVLETLVQVIKVPKTKDYLDEYIQAFSAYCKAMPCIENVCGSDHEEARMKRTKLKFKLDFDREQLKPDTVRSIKYRIAKHLEVRSSALYLCRIEEGCISLEFLVPTFILEDVLPTLTEAQKTALYEDVEVKALAIECKELNVVSIDNTAVNDWYHAGILPPL
jgi:hypothetical protein